MPDEGLRASHAAAALDAAGRPSRECVAPICTTGGSQGNGEGQGLGRIDGSKRNGAPYGKRRPALILQ